MSAQKYDEFIFRGEKYSLVAVEHNFANYNLQDFNIEIHTAPYISCLLRKYYLTYTIIDNVIYLNQLHIHATSGEFPQINGVECLKENNIIEYRNIMLPINYTGRIILGKNLIDDFYIHAGFQYPHAYGSVWELNFEENYLTQIIEWSQDMKTIRNIIIEKRLQEKIEYNIFNKLEENQLFKLIFRFNSKKHKKKISAFTQKEFQKSASLKFEDKWLIYKKYQPYLINTIR
jgi:hypothetical protein